MEFCPKCKSIMIYQGNKAVCRRCGYEKEVEEYEEVIFSSKNREDIPVIESDGIIKTLPTIEVVCPACGNREAYWWLRQLRAADESEVRFFRCTKCGKTWREYD
ncbi:transcription factor S [Archaeoglobales archaeon]|nr:MAG: transcription factor S [Archaeoglobales archaeon]